LRADPTEPRLQRLGPHREADPFARVGEDRSDVRSRRAPRRAVVVERDTARRAEADGHHGRVRTGGTDAQLTDLGQWVSVVDPGGRRGRGAAAARVRRIPIRVRTGRPRASVVVAAGLRAGVDRRRGRVASVGRDARCARRRHARYDRRSSSDRRRTSRLGPAGRSTAAGSGEGRDGERADEGGHGEEHPEGCGTAGGTSGSRRAIHVEERTEWVRQPLRGRRPTGPMPEPRWYGARPTRFRGAIRP
jgi:hypothetical protein